MRKEIELIREQTREGRISWDTAKEALDGLLRQLTPVKRVLLVPPDLTRCYSWGGKITDYLYHALQARSGSTSQVMIMPAVGTHCLMTR